MTRRGMLAVACFAVVALACPRPRPPRVGGHDTGELEELGAYLVHLTAKAQAKAALEQLPEGLPDPEVLALVTADDPPLGRRFEGYRVLFARQGGDAAVLVCTPDLREALLEDLGCTSRLDRKPWQGPGSPPCAFTVNIAEACAGE